MALTAKASKAILILNNSLPEEQRKFWVTSSEIRDRLITGGVHHALTLDHVSQALLRFNKDNVFLTKRRDRTVSYFRPSEFWDKCPDDQRWRDSGLPDRTIARSIMPPQDYFHSKPETCNQLSTLNQALVNINPETTS